MTEEKKKRIIIEVNELIHSGVKAKAARKSKTISQIFRPIIEKWLKKE